jgi:hypothetical protein
VARSPQQRSAAVAILGARGMRFEHEATAVDVDDAWRLRPLIFFPASYPSGPPASAVLTLRL